MGKKLAGFSLIEDQRHILFYALDRCVAKGVKTVLLCGDIYDTAIPTQAATSLLSEFLVKANNLGIKVLLIPGNHDSSERLGFASSLLNSEGVYIVSTLEEALEPIKIEGVNFYLLPFFKHYDVNRAFGTNCVSYEEATELLIEKMNLDKNLPNVLLCHQTVFLKGKDLIRSSSEDVAIGDVANIDANVFEDFTYVALGHIHKAQKVAPNAYYPGAIYKYHVDEADYEKTFCFVEISEKGFKQEFEPMDYIRNLRVIRGTMEEILQKEPSEDYVFLVLLDEVPVNNAMEKARRVFPYCIGLRYEVKDRESSTPLEEPVLIENASPIEMLTSFYKWTMQEELSDAQKELAISLFEGGEEE